MGVNISKELLIKLDDKYDLIKELFQTKNYTSEQIGEVINHSEATVNRYINYKNIKRLYEDKDWLDNNLNNNNLSYNAIAKLCLCSSSAVAYYAVKFNLRVRKPKQPKHNINEKFFSVYNRSSCYWAGFINADGHLADEKRSDGPGNQKFVHINLSVKDIEHLRKLNRELTSDNIIGEFTTNLKSKSHKLCRLRVTRSIICNDLNQKFDIAYNYKSLHEVISDKIPNKFVRDFIRGYFDGDGSVSMSKGGVFITVVGGKELCTKFKEIIDKEYSMDIGKITVDVRNEEMYLYRITNTRDAGLLFLYMYYHQCICLERKRDIFKQILCKI